MPKKIYTIENLDCANCAAKAEAKIRQVPGVEDAAIIFATMQLHLTAEDPDALLEAALAAARQVEADIRFLPKEHTKHDHGHNSHCGCDHHHHHEGCDCGHDHQHAGCGCGHHHDHEGCSCGHDHHHEEHHHHEGGKKEMQTIVLGGALFVAGLLLDFLLPSIPLHIAAFVAAYLVLGRDVLETAAKNLVRGKVFDENFLMSLATLGAFAIGEFPEAVGVMLFYRVGEYFEHRAVERSRSAIMEAVDLRPETVTLASGEVIPAEKAKVGDLLLVRPGDRIPLDAVVAEGSSRIDTAPITGESVPVSVKAGDAVISGCVNLSGQLLIRAEKVLGDSMVSRILSSVENAAAGKPKIDRFITRFSRVYTPVVVLLALLTAVVPSLFTGDWNYWVYTALSFLVMSCPCALVLSVPLAFFSGIGAGSRKGILFKDGISIEALAGVKAVVMDKTGTITKGDFTVKNGEDELLAVSASCEQHSSHPVAVSIVSAAKERGLTLRTPQELEEIAGHGICAKLDGKTVLCGNEKLMARYGIAVSADTDGTLVWVAVDGKRLGAIRISDTLKEDAKEAVKALKDRGISVAMLTGDTEASAKAVAAETGIDEVYARLLPEEKLNNLVSLRKKYGPVMFVGDGINDAPVLSGADVGAAMGSGADAAIEAADVVFMTSKVSAIAESVGIAKQTQRIAWQNVVFALAVKAAVMVLGLLGGASMWAAVFADSGVAMLCVLNSIRLLYRKK